jgi:hypothetical protein
LNFSVDTTLTVGLLFLFLALLEWEPFKVMVRLRGKIGNYVVFKRKKAVLTLYALVSYFFLIGFWIDLSSAPFGVYTNVMFVRFFSAHWVTLAALLVVVTVAGLFDIIKGVYLALFIGAWHEILWILSLASAVNNPSGVFGYYAATLFMLAAMLAVYYMAGFKVVGRRQEFLIVASMVAFDMVWLWMGFHITVENYLGQPNTVYFGSLVVNETENLSWIVPCAVACISVIILGIWSRIKAHRGLSTLAPIVTTGESAER